LIYLLNPKSLAWLCLLLILFSTGLRNIYFGVETVPLFTYTATFARLDALGVGGLLAILLTINRSAAERLFLPLFRVSGIALLLGMALFYSTGYRDEFFVRGGYTLLALFFGGLLLIVLSGHQGNFLREMFAMQFFRWFGQYSYGLYVIHYPVYYLLEMYMYEFYPEHYSELYAKAGLTASGLVITIPLALLSYRFLELPFLRLKRYFT
jgi:peptidoglycan/LPS O-acetylase OafA/YrhL